MASGAAKSAVILLSAGANFTTLTFTPFTYNLLMQKVTITMTLLVNDDACLSDWVPQSITEQLDPGEELLSYEDTERVWTVEELEELPELPSGMTQEQAQANYEQTLANLATVH